MKSMNHRMWGSVARFLLLAVLLCGRAAGALDTTDLKKVDLPFLPGERSVSQLVVAPDGKVYGTCIVSREQGPRLFRYDPQNGSLDSVGRLPDPLIQPEDLLGGAVTAWAWDPSWMGGYCLSDTGAMRFYKADGTEQELGQVAGTLAFAPTEYQVSKAIFFDAEGNVYTAGSGGAIYRYSPAEKKLEALGAWLPAVTGRESWASLDAAVLGPDGLVYGGTFDGYLFTFDPKTLEVVNLGKPLRQRRIQGLAFSKGKLYGIGGEDEGMPRAFAFDPKTRGFELGGLLRADTNGTDYPPTGIMKGEQGYIYEPIGAMVTDEQGNIYIGTTGRLGNLYVWEVEQSGQS